MVLQAEHAQAPSSSSTASSSTSYESFQEAASALDRSVKTCTVDNTATSNVAFLIRHAGHIQSVLAQSHLVYRRRRIELARAQLACFRWFTTAIPLVVQGLLAAGPDPVATDAWLRNLVHAVRRDIRQQVQQPQYSSHDFDFHPPEHAILAAVANRWHRRTTMTANEEASAIVDVVVSVVKIWVGWTSLATERLCWFLDAVEERLGSVVFGMNYVIQCIDSFRATHVLVCADARTASYPKSLEAFKAELALHPVVRRQSPEGRLVALFIAGLDSGSFNEAQDEGEDMWSRYVKMWRLSIEFVRDSAANPQDPFASLLRDDSDFYLPIREQATSRIRSRSSIGPYFPGDDRIRTLPGIYSAVIWRAITYRSDFSRDHSTMYFANPDALDAAIDSIISQNPGSNMTPDNKYFCNKGAYGTPTKRTMDNRHVYWKDLKTTKYVELVAQGRQPTFSDVTRVFDSLVVRTGSQKVVLLPQLGPLGKLNLSGDLVYAGVCPPPTVWEMAQQIVDVNAGAMAGLRALRCISDQWPVTTEGKIKAVACSLEDLLEALKAEFDDEDDWATMALDVISLEHSLCKFSRALKKKVI